MRQIPYKPPQQITVNWSGDAPLPIPKDDVGDKQQFIHKGDNTIPLASWHRMGASVEACEHIAAGRLSVVHRRHEFQEGDAHCIGCSLTREGAEAERVKAQSVKAKAPVTPAAS